MHNSHKPTHKVWQINKSWTLQHIRMHESCCLMSRLCSKQACYNNILRVHWEHSGYVLKKALIKDKKNLSKPPNNVISSRDKIRWYTEETKKVISHYDTVKQQQEVLAGHRKSFPFLCHRLTRLDSCPNLTAMWTQPPRLVILSLCLTAMMLSLELQSLKAVHAQSGEDTSVTALARSCTANLITLVSAQYEVNAVAGETCGDTET